MSETELGYKQTKIGKLPNDWEVSKLSDVCEIKGGKRLPKGYELQEHKNNIPYIRVADMYMGGICLDNIKYVPAEIADKIKNYKISSKDLFISVAGTLGIVGEVPEELDGANLTENADKLCNIKIDKKYLLNVLQSEVIQTIILSEMTNNAQPKLALTRIKEFLIPIPSIEEQEKIAEILSTWDSAIEKQEQLIEKKKEFKKGLMQILLSGEVRFKEFNDNWEKKKIGSILEEDKVIAVNPDINKRLTVRLNLKGIEKREIKSGEIEGATTHYTRRAGQFIYGKQNLHKGALAIIPNELDGFQSSSDLPAFNFNKDIYPLWFFYFISRESYYTQLEKIATGTGSKRIQPKELFEITIKTPEYDEQVRIAEVLKEVDKEIELLEKELEVLKLQKKGLMQRLLTGEVRVKV